MNFNILLTTTNEGKKEELLELSKDCLIKNVALEFILPETKLDVEETGSSLWDNAYLKARAYAVHYGKWALSDDSGLFLEDFPNIMGVETANFIGPNVSAKEKCLKVLDLYKDLEKKIPLGRKATFKTVLCFYQSEQEFYFFEGILNGMISQQYFEGEGFGYDPIFIPQDSNNSSSNDHLPLSKKIEWKKKYSHRSKALMSFIQFLAQQKLS